MAETLKLLNRAGTGMARPVGSTITTIYTCPPSTTATVKKGIATNYGANDITLKIYHIESGTTLINGAIIFFEIIPAYTSVLIDVFGIIQNIGTADTIRAISDTASSCNLTLYGAETT